MIKLDHISKRFGAIQVLNDFDIQIEDNEFIVLLGPSGCGKSTLLRIIAGLESVTSGSVVIDGKAVNALAPHERNIAMVFQDYALYWNKTCFKNISFNMELKKFDKKIINERTRNIARLLEIEDHLDSYPSQLSGGQRQRVGMARALVRDPAVFLFDEPLSNLDAKLRMEMCTEINRLHAQFGKTTIYVTHDQSEAMTLADRIVIMNRGVVEQSGKPLELYDHPKNTFVAGFLGSPSMNFIEGSIVSEEGKFYFSDSNNLLFETNFIPDAEGRNVIVGVRPEDIKFTDNDTSALPAEIEIVEQLGHVTHVFVNFSTHKLCVALQGRTSLKAGDRVGISTSKESLHVFDTEADQPALTAS